MDRTHATQEESNEQDGGGQRRRFTAGRALIVLVLLNIVVLAAFAVERRSRTDAEFCSSCHNMTAHVDSYLGSTHMDDAHRRAKVGCKDCHADYTLVDEMRSVVNFVAGNYDEVFARHKFGDEMCNGCHVSLEVQAAKTDHLRRNPHRGHYPDLRCGACHLAHARQIDYCGRCHDNGGQRMTGDPVVERAGAPWERMTTPDSDKRGALIMAETKGYERREFFRLAGLSTLGAGIAVGCGGNPVPTGDHLVGGGISFDRETDVLIVGAGGAGLWAAYAATDAGVSTMVVDKAPTYGGDTILSCGVLPVHGTKAQEAQGVEDKGADYWWDKSPIYSTGDRVPKLREISFTHSAKCVDIWTEKLGVEWMPFEEGYSYYFHLPAPGMGNVNRLLAPLFEYVQGAGADFLFDTRALAFILDPEDRVVGVRVREEVSGKVSDIKAKKILLATGDFIANQEKVAKYLPQWSLLPTTTFNSMGEGLDMAMAVGGSLENMDRPSNLTSDNAAVVVWGYWDPVIHVTPTGKRFVNENHGHDVAGELHKTGHLHWYCIFDDQLVNSQRGHSVEVLQRLGRVHRAHTLGELAALTHIPADKLEATVKNYNAMCKAGEDPEFGRKLYLEPLSPPYYAAYAVPVRYKTNGGLRIDEHCRLIDAADRPIPNVFAAGSCSGTVSPNVAPVVASGLYAGEQIVEELRTEGS